MARSLFDREPAPPVPWGGFDLLVVTGIYLLLQIFAAWLVNDGPPPIAPPGDVLQAQAAPAEASLPAASMPAVSMPGVSMPAVSMPAAVLPRDAALNPIPTFNPGAALDPAAPLYPVATLRPVGEPSRAEIAAHLNMKYMAAGSVASLLTMLLAILYLRLFRAATWSDLGLRLDHAWPDIRNGVGTFLVVAVPIYTLHWLANLFFEPQQGHPIVEAVVRFPGFFWLSLVTAVIVAPVAEEFFFRGLLLGWLDSLPTARDIDARGRPQLAFWPVILTSLGFAMLHLGHGAAPVALFFFSMVLGWLYQRHHRLLPCIALHAALNGTSMLLLAGELWRRGAW